ncbi:hypothetical protein Gpo141_00000795 [Globisporangium polare]
MQTANNDASSTAVPSLTDNEQQVNDDRQQQCHPSALLFSLQFFLSSVDLRLPPPTKSSESGGADFLVGFQLLQYEIVLFDAAPAASGESGGGGVDTVVGTNSNKHGNGSGSILLKHQHGKSCLFEADASHLALDLQRECDAPLALLVMQQDHGKARLVAFASVPVDLHVGLLNAPPKSSSNGGGGVHDAVTVSQDMRFRVCEWAGSSGKWELRDHCSRVVGVATGAVTLSCLGRSLAPHIVNAIGLQVDKAVLPVQDRGNLIPLHRSNVSVRDSGSSLDSSECESSCVDNNNSGSRRKSRAVTLNEGKNDGAKVVDADSVGEDEASGTVGHNEPVPAAKADMAVQCDQELMFGCEEGKHAERSHAPPRGHCWAYPAICIAPRKKLEHGHSSEKHLHPSAVKSRSPRMHRPGHGFSSHNGQRQINSSRHSHHVESDSSLFARDLPPPLFFQKPKQQQQQKKAR